MPKKTKLSAALEERLQLARDLRLEQAARRGDDVASHPDAASVGADALARLTALAREARRGSAGRRGADVAALRRRRKRFRSQAPRGTLPGNRTDELAAAFTDAELGELLALDAEGKAKRAEVRERREAAQAVHREAARIRGERQAAEEAEIAAEAHARAAQAAP